MPVLLRIALRNLREHRSKSIIVGTIIALGVAILLIGNSMMDTVKAGMRTAFIENYVGDVMVTASSASGLSLFGFSVNTGNEEFPTIPKYHEVYSYVSSLPQVEAVASQVIGYGMLSVGESAQLEGGSVAILWGIDSVSYRKMFPANVKIVAGSFLQPGEPGIMLSQKTVAELKKNFGRDINIGESLNINGIGTAGFRIREAPLDGIFAFNNSNQVMDTIGYLDVETLRALNGMVLATPDTIKLSEGDTALLAAGNPDDLFAVGMTTSTDSGTTKVHENASDYLSVLGSGSSTVRAPIDTGAWTFLLLRLKDSAAAQSTIAELNAYFAKNGIAARASDWLAASGPAGAFAYAFQVAFNGFVVVIAIVAVIIIMNTLVISVIERTSEIGMMRALGAQRSFIRRMFILETMSISVVFGAIGLALGSAVIGLLHVAGINPGNSFLQLMLGGKIFHPVLSGPSFITAVVVIFGIGFVSSVYPVMVALRVQPVRAIQSE